MNSPKLGMSINYAIKRSYEPAIPFQKQPPLNFLTIFIFILESLSTSCKSLKDEKIPCIFYQMSMEKVFSSSYSECRTYSRVCSVYALYKTLRWIDSLYSGLSAVKHCLHTLILIGTLQALKHTLSIFLLKGCIRLVLT
ncbi:hypothetical protein FKM82_006503 [Ascaphus truei]